VTQEALTIAKAAERQGVHRVTLQRAVAKARAGDPSILLRYGIVRIDEKGRVVVDSSLPVKKRATSPAHAGAAGAVTLQVAQLMAQNAALRAQLDATTSELELRRREIPRLLEIIESAQRR
jgi:hypothetical protein